MTRVLVVAASPVLRAGLEALLARSESLTVVGAAAGTGALAGLVEATEPDVVLVQIEARDDLALPIALAPDAAARAPAVVLLGGDGELTGTAWALDALRAGARAVLARDATGEEIVAAVEAAAAGLVALSGALAASLAPSRARPASAGPTPSLTPREHEILGMLAEGLVNKQIAARLGISEHTVKTHIGAVFAKLGANTRAEAVARGTRVGLIML